MKVYCEKQNKGSINENQTTNVDKATSKCQDYDLSKITIT